MKIAITDPARWAAKHFADTDLGDPRRSRRLVQVATALAGHAQGTLPQSFDTWAELLGAYRLLANPAVRYDQILAPSLAQTHQALRVPGEYLAMEDTTELDYTHREVADQLGRIGNDGGQGLWLHSTLGLALHGYDATDQPQVRLVGLLAQRYWRRDEPPHNQRESRWQRLQRPRESQRWAAAFDSLDPLADDVHWTYIADRESDIYETFGRCRRIGADFIIRANQPRALVAEDGSVFEKVAKAPLLGHFDLALRARPGHAARTAHLSVRVAPATVRPPHRPGGRKEPLGLYAVEVREIGLRSGQPIHWVLLTNRSVRTLKQAVRLVKTYACRWLLEEYHKVLKSGVGIEDSQLESLQSLQALLGILTLVAVRLLQWKQQAVADPQAPVTVSAEVRAILEGKYGRPRQGWTIHNLLIHIARLGGFLARKGDGMPGWQTLWRGWQRLMLMIQGYQVAHG